MASQPEPAITAERYVQEMVISDVNDRLRFGIRKYGTGLQASNGRDHLWDAYEEALDLVIYLRAEIEKRGGGLTPCAVCGGKGRVTPPTQIVVQPGVGSASRPCGACAGTGWVKCL
jgi:hypothetical protein